MRRVVLAWREHDRSPLLSAFAEVVRELAPLPRRGGAL